MCGTKANFLFFIRVCGRCMSYTRKGMLSESYIFKSFGFVLFLRIFHMCFTALLLFTVGYRSFSFMYIYVYIYIYFYTCFNSFFFLFLSCMAFRSFSLDASLWWTELVPISRREVSSSNLARYADYPEKENFSTVLAGKCHEKTLNFVAIASFLFHSNSLHTIFQ